MIPRGISTLLLLLAIAIFPACEKDKVKKVDPKDLNVTQQFQANFMDPHSHARPAEAITKHLDLDIEVDFELKQIRGTASYLIELKGDAAQIVLDVRDLDIRSVTNGADSLPFTVGESSGDFMGAPLEIQTPPGTQRITIGFATRPGAEALQWLSPEQTAGKEKPFLFTQSQAILARTWLPCQDSPGIRFSYSAKVKVPADLLPLMSAVNPQARNAEGVYTFEMKQAIPAYLMALAVGDLEFKSTGERTGVYAEPSMMVASAYEFADMEKMLLAAEELYGPYKWGRYDLIVLPPSFPFGGMENPCLTFATPTIIAGDRSLTALVAHELAHSWSGNLVTNATWNDFWLNEGFTVYFERRIMEKLYGKGYADMLAILGYQDLQATLADFGEGSAATCLKLDLTGQNPDDGMNDIAYEKGYLLLLHLEDAVGRPAWDEFLRGYFERHAFSSITTEGFVTEIEKSLVQGDSARAIQFDLKRWIFAPGLPDAHPVPHSTRFDSVDQQVARWMDGSAPADLAGTAAWSSHEWLQFLRGLPDTIALDRMAALDEQFKFTDSGNAEIQAAWFEVAIRNRYVDAYTALEKFLTKVGRRKFLRPLYRLMASTEEGKTMAKAIYEKARPNYHSVARGTIDQLLN
jgi:leukotriene-A4 hydrolase